MGSKKRQSTPAGGGRKTQAGGERQTLSGGGREGSPEDGRGGGARDAEARGGDAPSRTAAPTAFGWWRENIEAFLVAVILAVIIRHFSVEAFEIPTGSMANTLFGMHSWLECPNCSTEYNVALQNDSSTGQIRVQYRKITVYDGSCPNPSCTNRMHSRGPTGRPLEPGAEIECGACATRFRGDPARYRSTEAHESDVRCPICHLIVKKAVLEKSNKRGGHKILVTKFAYVFGKPKRWDVIVFEFDQWKNYIKRLVGLPGERIDVWDGDLYVNGRVERKHLVPGVQESLWTKISDSNVAERGLNPTPAWAEVATAESRRASGIAKNAEWNVATKRWGINAAGDAVVLRYQRGFDNYYSYNLLLDYSGVRGFPPDVQVGDRKVAFTVRVLPGARGRSGEASRHGRWVGAEIRDGDFSFQLRIPVGAPSAENPATLTRLVTDAATAPSVDRPAHPSGLRAEGAAAIAEGKAARIEMENLDDRVAVRLDGEEVLAIEYTSLPEGQTLPSRPKAPGANPRAHDLQLIASDVQADVESIRVWRDMYYIPRCDRGPWDGIELDDGEYFAMGDNAPSSSDGRYWGSIPEGNLMGKAFVVFWPAWPTNFQCKFIR